MPLAERGITGSEVVQVDLEREGFEPTQDRDRRFGLVHDDVLGNVEYQMLRFQTGLREHGFDPLGELGLEKLLPGQVDVDCE